MRMSLPTVIRGDGAAEAAAAGRRRSGALLYRFYDQEPRTVSLLLMDLPSIALKEIADFIEKVQQ